MSEIIEKLRAQRVDIAGIMERFLGDEELYEQCFTVFLEDEAFEKLNKAVKEEKYDEAFECAHMLKGVSGNLGLTELFETLSKVVSCYREKNFKEMAPLTQQVNTYKEKLEKL
ncbi:MAG: Hpt domain-containing protein [Oscillospiraceae bacterium]